MRPLLVGEGNPYGGDPYFALYPRPEGSAGFNLCHKILGIAYAKSYLDIFHRVNLCPQAWSLKVAREEAVRLRSVPKFQAILLGRKVAEAFRLEDVPPFTVHLPYGPNFPRNWIVLLPHPSGRCLEWNVPGNIERARALVRGVYPYDMLVEVR